MRRQHQCVRETKRRPLLAAGQRAGPRDAIPALAPIGECHERAAVAVIAASGDKQPHLRMPGGRGGESADEDVQALDRVEPPDEDQRASRAQGGKSLR